MLRREALLSLLAAPLAWLRPKPKAIDAAEFYAANRRDLGEPVQMNPGTMVTLPANWTLERIAREYKDSHELYCKVISRL